MWICEGVNLIRVRKDVGNDKGRNLPVGTP
jgi:hypothetical protein